MLFSTRFAYIGAHIIRAAIRTAAHKLMQSIFTNLGLEGDLIFGYGLGDSTVKQLTPGTKLEHTVTSALK